MTSEQEQVAGAPFTKLRLGVVNSHGEQKGVDSLIVTDLIDLARNRAITNALLVSGDEDIRIGVQIAQTFGVQVHLMGIKPARGSQSPDLIQEADTHHELDEATVQLLITIKEPPIETTPAEVEGALRIELGSNGVELGGIYKRAIDDTLDAMDAPSLDSALKAYRINNMSVPPELDRPTLGRIRSLLGRDLSDDERKAYRTLFRNELASM